MYQLCTSITSVHQGVDLDFDFEPSYHTLPVGVVFCLICKQLKGSLEKDCNIFYAYKSWKTE